MGTIGKVRKVCGKAKKKKSYEKWNETENAPRETQRKSMSAYGDAIALMPAAVVAFITVAIILGGIFTLLQGHYLPITPRMWKNSNK